MIALSFYIGCFRLSSGKESHSKWRRALFRGSGAERKRRLRYGCQRLRTRGTASAQQQLLGPDVRSLQLQGATSHIAACFVFDHEEAINILTAANVMSICLVHDQIRTGVRSDVAGGC